MSLPKGKKHDVSMPAALSAAMRSTAVFGLEALDGLGAVSSLIVNSPEMITFLFIIQLFFVNNDG